MIEEIKKEILKIEFNADITEEAKFSYIYQILDKYKEPDYKWKCDICNTGFNNFHAQGFDNKIYCPLCYYKKLYKDRVDMWEELKTKYNYWNGIDFATQELEKKHLNKEV